MSEPRFQKTKAGAGVLAASAVFIGGWEGYRNIAVHERIDPPGVVTVCNGITNYDIPGLKVGAKFTDAQCAEAFAKALPKYDEPLMRCVTASISDNTHVALLSASYNLGTGTVCKSSIIRKINAGNLEGGCNALLLYTKANGKFVQGLLNRRREEQKLCVKPDNTAPAKPVSKPKPKPVKKPAPQPKPPQDFVSWLFGWRS